METAAEPMRPFHRRMANLHRATEHKHRVAADLHAGYAEVVVNWATRPEKPGPPPTFMTAVAKASGLPSLAVTLFGSDKREAAVVVSDSVAAKAHDLEYLFGEGPSRIALGTAMTLSVRGESALAHRWPDFGPAARELGVQAVVSARLGPSGTSVGSLTAYRSEPDTDPAMTRWVKVVADALTVTALHPALRLDGDDGLPAHPLFGDVDLRVVVHQATGMVMTTHECTASDALDLIRAHAFAQNESVTEVARSIVSRTSRIS